MKRVSNPTLSARQQGFSLLELLIGTTIGLVITMGAIAVFANSTSASKTTEAQSRMNEDAQAVLSLLSREIKMAGNNPINSVSNGLASRNPISALTLRACSGLFVLDANSINDDKLKCETGSTSQPNSLFLRYEADKWNTLANAGTPTDCLGFKLTPQNGSPSIAENHYYIGSSQSTLAPSLYCQGNGGSGFAQPLVENIEDMKFSFGTTAPVAAASAPQSSETAGQIAGYLSATEVEKLALSQSEADNAKAWNQVLTVQICIVVRSEAKNLVVDTASSTYTNCDGTQDASQTDKRLRRAYTTTVALRNRLN